MPDVSCTADADMPHLVTCSLDLEHQSATISGAEPVGEAMASS
jgi:hypothetical protein